MKWWRRIPRAGMEGMVTIILWRKSRRMVRGVTFKFFGYNAVRDMFKDGRC